MMTTSGPSSNWLALQKRLVRHGHPRKRRKVDGDPRSEIPRDSSSQSPRRHESDKHSEIIDLETTEMKNGESVAALRKMVLGKVEYKDAQTGAGKYLALDCEMVGVGIEGSESSLARVSIVSYTGAVILDVFVRQRERVVDYRTQWSGVRSTDLAGSAKPFNEVQQIVADLIKDRILVGHAIYNDLKALLLSHPSPQIRDTQSLAYKYRVVKSRRPALRVLVKEELGIVIQAGEHNSVTDARATMALFRLYKKQWESGFRPLSKVLHLQSGNKQDDLADRGSTPTKPTSTSGQKRKHKDYPHDDRSDEASNSSSQGRTNSPTALSIPHAQTSTAYISTVPQRHKQASRLHHKTDVTQRKGISLGISTVIKRADGLKEVQRKGSGSKGNTVGNDTKGRKSVGEDRDKWWKSLGGGKKGGIGL